MTEEMMKLKANAEYYRDLYRTGKCSREIAKEEIMPYLDKVNEKAMELSKKYKFKIFRKIKRWIICILKIFYKITIN